MSCFLNAMSDSFLSIPRICEVDGIIYYEILVKIGPKITWTVKHRYSDFRELHDKLVETRSVSKDLLPPKKVIGNKSPQFLEKRRSGLEKYLQDIFIYLQQTMPRDLVEFLDMHRYDVIFLLQSLANKFFLLSETLWTGNHIFSVLDLHCISERLKIPCPPAEYSTREYDFSHILDFCTQLRSLTIIPNLNAISDPSGGDPMINYNLGRGNAISSNKSNALKPIGTSNIIPNDLTFELSVFKNLTSLTIKEFSPENIYHTGTLRKSLERIAVHRTSVQQLNKILLCDDIHKSVISIDGGHKNWISVIEANFSSNCLTAIDASINTLPNIQKLFLDCNAIERISNLNNLSALSVLSLSENNVSECIDLHLELGNLIELNLSQNTLKSLYGFRKLYSLQHLDLSCNLIDNVDEVDHIAALPCLENLRLTGNPVAGSVDYRPRVLSRFASRANEIYLDNEKASQPELDKALVLNALRMSQKNTNNHLNSLLSSSIIKR